MGKGKKHKGSKQISTPQRSIQQQEMSERNVVQEEGFESDDDKNTAKSSLVKVGLHGSDSEEDNAAAGGGLINKSTDSKEKKNLQSSTLTNLHKKKNKATGSAATNAHSINPQSALPHTDHNGPTQNCAPQRQENNTLNYENLGHIVVRLLPSEYQAERLPDGRYVMNAAAIGYLAQKLGH